MNKPLAAGWAPGNRGPLLFAGSSDPGGQTLSRPGHPRRAQKREQKPPGRLQPTGGAGSKGKGRVPQFLSPGQPCPVRADGVTRLRDKLLAGSLHTHGSEAYRPQWQSVDVASAMSGLLLCRGWDNRLRPAVLPGSEKTTSSSVPREPAGDTTRQPIGGQTNTMNRQRQGACRMNPCTVRLGNPGRQEHLPVLVTHWTARDWLWIQCTLQNRHRGHTAGAGARSESGLPDTKGGYRRNSGLTPIWPCL